MFNIQRSKSSRRGYLRVSLCLVALSPGWAASGWRPTDIALSSLTVPELNLPGGCRLLPTASPSAPSAPAVRNRHTVDVVTSHHFPGNPWIGADRGLLIELRNRVDGVPRVPDAPTLAAADLAAWDQKWVASVVEGYRAAYGRSVVAEDAVVNPSASVRVSAIRFSDADLATPSPTGILRTTHGVSVRLVKGAVVVRVEAGSKTDCFSAVAAYVRDVSPPRQPQQPTSVAAER